MTHHSDSILSQNLLIFEGFFVRSFSLGQILVLSELKGHVFGALDIL